MCCPSLRDEGPGDNDSVRRLWLHSHFTAGTELLNNAKLDVWNCLQMDFNIKWAPRIYWPWDLWLGSRCETLSLPSESRLLTIKKQLRKTLQRHNNHFYSFQNWKINKKLSFPKVARLRLDSNLILKWSRAQQKPCGCWLRCYSVWRAFDHGFMWRDCYVTPARGWTGRSVLIPSRMTLWKQQGSTLRIISTGPVNQPINQTTNKQTK